MSGKYLHGLVIDGDLVFVKENIFSHSELRKVWTDSEKKHKLIQEWSWDYVTRQFVDTGETCIPLCKNWINKNLSSLQQLTIWIDKNWEGLVNGDEIEREVCVWDLLGNPSHPDKLINIFLKADADWKKADADRVTGRRHTLTYADWKKTYDDWKKAYNDWKKGDKEWKTKNETSLF